MRFEIELPLPPTANNAYPTNPRTFRRYLSPRAKAWKIDAGWMIKAAKPPRLSGYYTFVILVPMKARGDADGYIKLPQDLLASGRNGLGVTPNDRLAISSRADRDVNIPARRCRVIVEEL